MSTSSAVGQSYSTATRIVRVGSNRMEIRPSLIGRVVAGVFLLVGIGMAVAALNGSLFSGGPSGHGLLGLFSWGINPCFGGTGVIFALVGLLFMFGGTRRMSFDSRRRVMRLGRAVRGLGRRIPFDDIEAVEIIPDSGTNIAGKIDLLFARPPGLRLGVTMREAEDRLLSDASALAEFIGVPLCDARQVVVPGEQSVDGDRLSVSRSFNPSGAANFQTHKLVQTGPDMLEVRATRRLRMFRSAFLIGGVLALLMGPLLLGLSVFSETGVLVGALLGTAICSALGVAFILLATRVLKFPPIFMDRVGGVIHGEKLLLAGQPVGQLPMRSVKAVQIVAGQVMGDDSYTAYQINLILSQPPGDRLTLMAFRGERQIRLYARTLADFMDVPLMDNSSIAESDHK